MRGVQRLALAGLMILLLIAGPMASPTRAEGVRPAESRSRLPAATETGWSVPGGEFRTVLAALCSLPSAGNRDGSVRIGILQEPETLNGLLAGSGTAAEISGLIFENLVGSRQPDCSYGAAPELAVSWNTTDNVTYTITLDSNARWSDGTDLTADDIAFTFDRLFDDQIGSPLRSPITKVVAPGSYRVIDADTFEINAAEPAATFVEDILMAVPIMPRHVWDGVPTDQWRANVDLVRVAGTGPFKLTEWVAGDHITQVRNDDYWTQPMPNLTEIVWRFYEDPCAMRDAKLADEIDVAEVSPTSDCELVATADVTVEVDDTFSFSYLGFNLDPERPTLFQEREVRQALLYAIDRPALIESILHGYGTVPISTQPEMSIAYDPEANPYPYDPDHARQLLAELSWTDSTGDGTVDRGGQELRFRLISR